MNYLGLLHWTVVETKQIEGALQITATYDLSPLFCLQCSFPLGAKDSSEIAMCHSSASVTWQRRIC